MKQYRADGHDDLIVAPRLLGRTAAVSAKGPRSPVRPRDEVLASSSVETRRLHEFVIEFALEHDLTVKETPVGLVLATQEREWLATVYLDPYNYLEVYIQALRNRGWDAEADAAIATLQATTEKRLSLRHPAVPAADVFAHWQEVKAALTSMAELYGSIDARP